MSSPPDASSAFFPHFQDGRRWHARLALVSVLLGAFPSNTLNRTRRVALKACGIRIGDASFFLGLPTLQGRGPIASRLRVGAYCGLNEGCVFDLAAPVTIGDHVAAGHEVRFLTSVRQDGVETAASITIGDGVWLGARVTLMGGVTIGAGSIIGAGLTVSADVPPNTLMTGTKPISLAKWR